MIFFLETGGTDSVGIVPLGRRGGLLSFVSLGHGYRYKQLLRYFFLLLTFRKFGGGYGLCRTDCGAQHYAAAGKNNRFSDHIFLLFEKFTSHYITITTKMQQFFINFIKIFFILSGRSVLSGPGSLIRAVITGINASFKEGRTEVFSSGVHIPCTVHFFGTRNLSGIIVLSENVLRRSVATENSPEENERFRKILVYAFSRTLGPLFFIAEQGRPECFFRLDRFRRPCGFVAEQGRPELCIATCIRLLLGVQSCLGFHGRYLLLFFQVSLSPSFPLLLSGQRVIWRTPCR
jgi:hypothetical protein